MTASLSTGEPRIKAVLFDFGGVLAREGFRNGLKAIAGKHGLDPDRFFEIARGLVYSTGYVLGRADEADYWDALRRETGIAAPNEELRQDILDRFVLNAEVVEIAKGLKKKGLAVGILSDQSNWLEELDRKCRFLRHFDPVFNSFRLHKGKKDPSVFRDVSEAMGRNPGEVLFIDDSPGNVERASSQGMKTILFKDAEQLKMELDKLQFL